MPRFPLRRRRSQSAPRHRLGPPGRPRARSTGERGAIAVEAALILPVFCLLVFGAVEYGLMFRTVLSFSEASRAAARVAAALPRSSGYESQAAHAVEAILSDMIDSDGVDKLVVYKADPNTGLPVGGGQPKSCASNCWTFTWNPSTRTFSKDPGHNWPAASQKACGSEASTDYVGVYVEGRYKYITGLFDNERLISERTVMRLEPVGPSEQCQP